MELTCLEDARDLADATARSVLERCHITDPPVDALKLAALLDIEITFEPDLRTGPQQKRVRALSRHFAGKWYLMLEADDRPERHQWACAHEICEAQLWGKIEGRWVHEVANFAASSLLMPDPPFSEHCRSASWDLLALKAATYSTCSHEALARRMLWLREDLVITCVDNGSLTWRLGSCGNYPAQPIPVESDCIDAVTRSGQREERSSDLLNCYGFPVFENGWKRVFLRTDVDLFADPIIDEDAFPDDLPPIDWDDVPSADQVQQCCYIATTDGLYHTATCRSLIGHAELDTIPLPSRRAAYLAELDPCPVCDP